MDIIRISKDYEIIGYTYIKNKQPVVHSDTLAYIKNLHIPPAWKDVHICTDPDSKIQAYGYDSKGRKQVLYAKWFSQQNKTDKYNNIIRLEPIIEEIKKNIQTTLATYISKSSKTQLTNEIQIALILHIMMICNFRIGNTSDTKSKEKAYGLTTLQWKHVHFKDKTTYFEFVGKKGVINKAVCNDPYIYSILHRMKNVYNKITRVSGATGVKINTIFSVNSSQVNAYLHTYDPYITSKDIRTWMANELYIKYFFENKEGESKFEKRQRNALAHVAENLHNTPAVCKTSYILPDLLEI